MFVSEPRIFSDLPKLIDAVSVHIVSLAADAISRRGVFSIMLSGGSTPRALHERLAGSEFIGKLDWEHVQVFWGDERSVPPNHPDSNYRMVRESLLDHVPIPTQNIHRIRGELDPQEAADQYERDMRRFFSLVDDQLPEAQMPKCNLPVFDLILLGMGGDGHTASLFPGSSALREQERWVVAVEHKQPPPPLVPRVTVTPVVINAASQVIFLVTGSKKADHLRQVLNDPYQPELLPAQIVKPANGQLLWFVDQAAAGG